MSRHSLILELHAFPFLERVRTECGAADLGEIPGDYLRQIRREGFDAVWLMGVWERSPASRAIAVEHPALREEYGRFNPDWVPGHVIGSPYSIHRYEPDARLGGREGLARFRQKANQLGLKVILDFVPNHLACDHPWIVEHPEYFVGLTRPPQGDESPLFFASGSGRWTAHGRDPYFPSWTDTAQVNYFEPAARSAVIGELLRIFSMGDGVRCDMAMLPLREVFERTWSRWTQSPPDQAEFWPGAIGAVKERYPEAIFIAEVYWGLEGKLIGQGFDYVYDKELYDRLLASDAPWIRGRTRQDWVVSGRSLRFCENHDEPRAAEAFGPVRDFAAAVIALSGPGLGLVHQGQADGARRKAPVQIGVWPAEESNEALAGSYSRLYGFLSDRAVRQGDFEVGEPVEAWAGNTSNRSWVVHLWRADRRVAMAAVNLTGHPAQARVRLPEDLLACSGKVYLKDAMDGQVYEREKETLRQEGFFMDLAGWGVHLFTVDL